jgi:DNA (cytosine-5)-methyltransferase 1
VLGVEHSRAAHAAHVANVGPCELANVTTWSPKAHADLVAGGVPCQPFSVAGDRGGLEEAIGSLFPDVQEPRVTLYIHLVRIAAEANARAVMLENVPGLLTWNDGEALAAINDEMRSKGYEHVHVATLNAADYGTPQRRRRVFIVAFRSALDFGSFRWPAKTHGEGRIPWVTVRQALGLGGEPVAGSRLDQPAPTITSIHDEVRDRFVPSRRPRSELAHALAEVGAVDPRGGSPRLTIDQAACFQGFNWAFKWPKHPDTAHLMIGNAVPPQLGKAVGGAVALALSGAASEAA